MSVGNPIDMAVTTMVTRAYIILDRILITIISSESLTELLYRIVHIIYKRPNNSIVIIIIIVITVCNDLYLMCCHNFTTGAL